MPTNLIDKDGNAYTADTDEQAQQALQSGHFQLAQLAAPVPSNPPIEPTLPPEPVSKKQPSKFIDHSNMNADMDKLDAGNDEELPIVEKTKPLASGKVADTLIVKDKDGNESSVSPDVATDLVKAGTHTSEDVPLIDEHGNLYNSPDTAKTQQALQTGMFRFATLAERNYDRAHKDEQAAIDEYGGTGVKPYIGGTADAFLTGVAHHNPVTGIGLALADAVEGTNVRQEGEKIAEDVKSKFPAGYYAGAGTGEVASAFGLGGVGGGLTKALGLKGAAKIATEGVVYSADSVINHVVDKDPMGAAEALALGVGANFGIHGIFSALGGLHNVVNETAQDVADKLGPAGDAAKEQENLIAKDVFGLTPPKVAEFKNRMGPGGVAKALKAAGITPEDIAQGNFMDKLQGLEDSGPKIGAAIKELDEGLLPSEKKPIIEEHLQKAEQEIHNLMPQEVKDMKGVSDRLNQLFKVEHPDNLPLAEKAQAELTKYNDDMDKFLEWRDQRPPAPYTDEWIESQVRKQNGKPMPKEAGNENPTVGGPAAETPTVKPGELAARGMEGHPTAGNESPTIRPGEEVRVEGPESDPRSLKERLKDEQAGKQPKWDEWVKNRVDAPRLPRIWSSYLEAEGQHTAAQEEIEQLMKKLEDMPKLPPDAMQAQRAIKPLLEQLQATVRRGTFDATQKLKIFLREQTNFGKDNAFANNLRKRVYGIVSEHLMNAEDAAAAEGGLSPEIVVGLQQQRLAYTLHKLLGDAADRMEAKLVPESALQKLAGIHHPHQRALPIMMLHLLGMPSPIAVGAGLAMPFFKKYLANQNLKKAAAALLGESTTPETNTVLHAMQMQKITIDEGTKDLLSALASRSVSKVPPMKDAIMDFVPDGTAKNHKEALSILHDQVVENHANPEAFASHLGTITAGLRNEGLHQVADAYTTHQLRLMKVLQTVLPADPFMKTAHPFSTTVQPEEIDAATKVKYNRALTIASNPTALLEMVKSNNITAGDVAIAAAVNPSTLQQMREALVHEALKSKPNLSYQQRLSMGVLMGTNLDESTNQLPVLQDTYTPPTGIPSAKKKPGSPKALSVTSANNLQDQYLTQSEKSLTAK